MSNSSIIRNYFKENNIYTEEVVNEQGEIIFRFRQNLTNGANVVIVVAFDTSETAVDIQIFNIAKITNPLKEEAVHTLVNQLNGQYRYVKFIEAEGNIYAQYSYNTGKNIIDLDLFVDSLLMTVDVAEQSYPKFMKLLWG